MPEMMTLLMIVHYVLIGLGTLVGIVALFVWIKRGRFDLLRGSPFRGNRLSLITIWFCGVILTLSWWIAPPIATFLAPDGLEGTTLDMWQTVLASNLSHILIAAACLIVAHMAFREGLRGLGFSQRAFGAALRWAVPGWLVATAACNALNSAATQLVEWLGYKLPLHSTLQALRDTEMPQAVHAIAIVGAFVVAPIGEEVFFRGIIQTGLHRASIPRWGSMQHRWTAIIATATLFGLMHFSTPHQIPALIVLGIILGYLYERTGSLFVPILVHMLFNGKTLLWFQIELWTNQ
jgi:membrane protease YdiL (CAAX protease family)